MLKRIIIGVIIFLTVIEGWWFVALPGAIVAAWFFPYYAELVLFGLVYDSLFGFQTGGTIRPHLGILMTLLTLSLVYFLKKSLRRSG